MGVQLKYGTAGATGGGWSSQPGTLQPALVERGHEPRWQWQGRAPKTWKDKNWWVSLWPRGRFMGGTDGSTMDGMAPVGQQLAAGDGFEPFSCDGEGTQTLRFILGTCVDASAVPVANATVQAFITVTDLAGHNVDVLVGEDVSRLDGTYLCGVQTVAGVNHRLVAYKPGSPDIAGTTVNTLTSTNVDGT